MKTTTVLILLSLVLLCVSATHADTFGSGANTFDIEFVTIGNAGNTADTTGEPNPAGSVPYAYRIANYEISEDMINKANALDSLGITHDNHGTNQPATSIDWYEAAKFVNWLNTTTNSTPAYKFDGSGNFQLWDAGDTGYDPNNLFRNRLARYFLPNLDEWYKAAYYEPSTGNYFDYPTGSNTLVDGMDFPGDTTFDAVFDTDNQPGGGVNSLPNDITDVGLLSPYGTAGQGGNVWEWQETQWGLVNNSVSFPRIIRGGGYSNSPGTLNAAYLANTIPTTNGADLGFRVASVIPEPSALVLVGVAMLALMSAGSRRRVIGGPCIRRAQSVK